MTAAPAGVTSRTIAPDPAEVQAARPLPRANSSERGVESRAELERRLARSRTLSPITLVALDPRRVIGLLRALTDGMGNGCLSMRVGAAAERLAAHGPSNVTQAAAPIASSARRRPRSRMPPPDASCG